MNELKCLITGRHHGARALLLAAALVLASASALPAQVRVMPLGDSLTSSIDGEASYRYWLWNLLKKRGYAVDFVGTLWGVGDGASGIFPNFDQDHEGHPGATTSDILYGLNSWAAETQPDVVLLLIGGNDFEQGRTPAEALEGTRQIIATLRTLNPRVVILWAMIPPATDHNKEARAYNAGVARYAHRWSTSESPIRIVNLWSGFSAWHDTVDGQHPNASGEKKYALRFYYALARVLK